jgi:hypothetical protein
MQPPPQQYPQVQPQPQLQQHHHQVSRDKERQRYVTTDTLGFEIDENDENDNENETVSLESEERVHKRRHKGRRKDKEGGGSSSRRGSRSNTQSNGLRRQLEKGYVRSRQHMATEVYVEDDGSDISNLTSESHYRGDPSLGLDTPLPEKFDHMLAMQNFQFQRRRGKLDLEAISRLDLDKIMHTVDIEALQAHLDNLVYSDVANDDLQQYSDRHFVKLYQLSQFCVEYLLNVQVGNGLATRGSYNRTRCPCFVPFVSSCL